jgi:hypothetical protein
MLRTEAECASAGVLEGWPPAHDVLAGAGHEVHDLDGEIVRR